MKILGLSRDVVNFLLNKVEVYMRDFHANSFEEYEKNYVEQMLSMINDSLPFFKFEENFKIILEEKAREYAEKHFYDDLNRCYFIINKEDVDARELLAVMQEGKTMEWLKEHHYDGWITEELKNRYGMGAIEHHTEKVLLRYVEIALSNNFFHVYTR
jgi:hypothetical protein